MKGNRTEEGSNGQLTLPDRYKHKLILETIKFVYRQLPAWRDDPHRPDEQLEDKLNFQLCNFLNSSRARNDFPMVLFGREAPQTGLCRGDLAASPAESMFIGAKLYTTSDIILVLECKRLPAPRKDRKKEYVTGGRKSKSGEIKPSGGIQRFKLGLHGANLDRAVMIGYIQKHSACYWHQEINDWILKLSCEAIVADGCVWNDSEKLEPLDEDLPRCIASCRSVHKRIASKSCDEIIIHHLWVTMNTEGSQNNN